MEISAKNFHMPSQFDMILIVMHSMSQQFDMIVI